MKRLICVVVIISFIGSGCATIFCGKYQDVSVNTDPEGAEVYVDRHKKGVTPIELEIPRKKNATIKLKKEGYRDEFVLIKQRINPLCYLSYLLGPIILIDYGTGAIWSMTPTDVEITLEPEEPDNN